jgi:hypothetical protein
MILWRHQPPVFSIPIPDQLTNRTRYFNHGCERIAPVTHQDQAFGGVLLSPWRICRPRRTLVPLCVQCLSQLSWLPTSGANPLLARVAGDPFTARATVNGIPFSFLAYLANPFAGLAATVVTHAKQRATSKGFCSFRMW